MKNKIRIKIKMKNRILKKKNNKLEKNNNFIKINGRIIINSSFFYIFFIFLNNDMNGECFMSWI